MMKFCFHLLTGRLNATSDTSGVSVLRVAAPPSITISKLAVVESASEIMQ